MNGASRREVQQSDLAAAGPCWCPCIPLPLSSSDIHPGVGGVRGTFAAHVPLSKGGLSFTVEHRLPPSSHVQTTCGFPCCKAVRAATGVSEPGGKVGLPGAPVPSKARAPSPSALWGMDPYLSGCTKPKNVSVSLAWGGVGWVDPETITVLLTSWEPDFDMSNMKQAIPDY